MSDDIEQLNKTESLLKYLTTLCRDLAEGRYADTEMLFELTKKAEYPRIITDLAESFGMMLVKVEAREFHLRHVADKLVELKVELEIAKEKLARENLSLKRSFGFQFSPRKIIGQSKSMQSLFKQVERIADTPVNVLITGETGTGKELIAKSLHYNSHRSDKPFIAFNCGAIPDTLLESELFGIEKGVATGVEKRIGRIEQAHGGTLFMDEIGDMPLNGQVKLLRVLEEREVYRLGGAKPIPVDIRIVSATHTDLLKYVEDNRFRKDLYYRLKVIQLHIPPLRERPEDIPLLISAFLEIHTRRLGRGPMRFSKSALSAMQSHVWPGNVRELENEVERAAALTVSDTIEMEDLSPELYQYDQSPGTPALETVNNLKELEKIVIQRVLRDTRGNKSEAARRLGISREGLRKKMKQSS